MRIVPVSEVLGVELADFDIKRPCGPAEQVAELPRNEGEAVLQELFRRLYSDEKCLHPQVADQ
jgi:hypothetical protein